MPEEQQHEEEETEMPSENYCDFTVYISDETGKKGLVIEATTMDTEIAFNNVMCADNIEKVKEMGKFDRSMT